MIKHVGGQGVEGLQKPTRRTSPSTSLAQVLRRHAHFFSVGHLERGEDARVMFRELQQ